jgi:hypothetical protein
MPRIAFEYESLDQWYERTGEGSSSFDVCQSCLDNADDSRQLLKDVGGTYNGDPNPSEQEEVSHHDWIDVDIDEHDYECEVCKVKLNSNNY